MNNTFFPRHVWMCPSYKRLFFPLSNTFFCSCWFKILHNTEWNRHFLISSSAQLVDTSIWGTATLFWPHSLQLIQTAAGSLVFCPPEFLHVTLILLSPHWLPVVAHFKSKTWCTRLQMSAHPHPSRPWSVRALHTSQSMPCTLLIMWPGNHSAQPWLFSLLALKNIGMTFPPQPGPRE